MKRKQFFDEQIIGILKEAEAGVVVTDLCRRHGKSTRALMATLEPWYDWGKIGVERMESLRPGKTATDGEVRFFELQWLGVHIAFQIGRTPKGAPVTWQPNSTRGRRGPSPPSTQRHGLAPLCRSAEAMPSRPAASFARLQ